MKWNEKTFTKLTYLSDVRISPDGKIAYVLTKANLNRNKYETTVVVEKDGIRRYIENATTPRFSPDGNKLIFTKKDEKNKSSLVYVMDLRSMSSRKVIEVKNLVDIKWNNDGRRIMLESFKRNDDPDFWFEDTTPVWFDSKGFLDSEKSIFQLYDIESGELIDEFKAGKFSRAIWHGDSIVYTVPKERDPFKLYDIFIYKGGKHEKLFENVSFSAIDSNSIDILLLGKPKKKYASEHSFLYLYNGKEVIPLTEKYAFENYGGKFDGNDVYFATVKEGRIVLEKISKHKKSSIVDEKAFIISFDVRKRRVALIKSTPDSPGEIYLYDGKLKRITDYNSEILKRLGTRPYNYFKYKSFDGTEIEGWYIKPKTKKKAPLIVFVHGGPKGMYGYGFNYNMQLLANNGFYALFVNPRGSGGYSEEFALKVIQRTGLEDFKDILEGVKWLLKNENGIDKERVGITGISYGGFMTNWAITQTDMFKAAVSENGISYWLTSYAFSDIGLWFDREVIGENPLKNENYKKLSPIFYAENVKAPVLFIHSLEDYRCPLDQSLMFYHVLKALGKEAYMAIFKKGPHGHSVKGLPKHRMKRYKLVLNFFTQKLKRNKEKFEVKGIIEKK